MDSSTIPFVSPRISNQSGAYREVRRCADLILNGRVLVIDPSIGSYSSMPGYALYEKSVLVDSGIIEIPAGASTHRRLYELGRTLREDFTGEHDVLVVENVPSLRFSKFGRSLASQVPLHRATGAIIASVQASHCVEVHPGTWRAYIDAQRYIKSDESDAVVMGHACIEMARHSLEHPPKKKVRRRKKNAKEDIQDQ